MIVDFSVRVILVIEHLIFQTEATFGAVFHTTVARLGNFPLKAELKVFVACLGDDVSTLGVAMDDTVLNLPAFFNRSSFGGGPGRKIARCD